MLQYLLFNYNLLSTNLGSTIYPATDMASVYNDWWLFTVSGWGVLKPDVFSEKSKVGHDFLIS